MGVLRWFIKISLAQNIGFNIRLEGKYLNINIRAEMTIATLISLNSTGIEISASETLWREPDRASLVLRGFELWRHSGTNTWRDCIMCHVIHLHCYITSRHCPLTAHLWYLEFCTYCLTEVWDSELQRNGNSNLEYIYICWKLWHVAIFIWFKHFLGCIVFWFFSLILSKGNKTYCPVYWALNCCIALLLHFIDHLLSLC